MNTKIDYSFTLHKVSLQQTMMNSTGAVVTSEMVSQIFLQGA